MAQAKTGDTVKVHYTGKLDDGTVFDSSENREPLEFKIGENQIIPGFEKAIEGMTVGDTKNIQVPADEAYGEYHNEMVINAKKSDFPTDLSPEVGMQIQIRDNQGGSTIALITDIQEEAVTLDANHPLAGKDLNFDIELVEIA